MTTPEPKAPPLPKPNLHARLLCRQRKGGCDKQKPCANCVRARAECIYNGSSRSWQRTATDREEELLNRLGQYEALLKRYGAKVDDIETGNIHASKPNDEASRPMQLGSSPVSPTRRVKVEAMVSNRRAREFSCSSK